MNTKKNSFILLLSIFLAIPGYSDGGSKVEILKTDTGHQLQVNGESFYIKGAGIDDHYDVLAASGGNSIRTWGVGKWEEVFEMAEQYNLYVCAGIWLGQERQGFDYSDPDAVRQQFERFKPYILKYKDHPNLLMWGIGNELNLFYTNTAVWNAVEEFARYIHEVDGNHPTMTTTTFIERREAELIQNQCPSIDILGVNAYAGLPVVADWLNDFGWTKPYILGEWGTFGHWEASKTSWNKPIEFTSKEKADLYLNEYQKHILPHENCLGSYVFFWGSKQERTSTWYSLFLNNGAKTQAVDVLHYLWKNEWPENRAPVLDSLMLDGKNAHQNNILSAGTVHEALVWANDPDDDELNFTWDILHGALDKKDGGDEEEKPPVGDYKTLMKKSNSFSFKAPITKGPYLLFVYVYDEIGNGAHANISFFVE